MAIITEHNQLSEIIIAYPNIIPLINRFNIKLGTHDKTIKTICRENNLETDFFTSILNTYINNDYFPEKALKSFHANTIINYITQTYNYYLKYSIPNIDRHFTFLISQSGDNNNLPLLKSLFDELKQDIFNLIEFDTKIWFPSFFKRNYLGNTLPSNCSNIEEKVNDLKNMFIIHLTGNYEPNLCYAVILAIINIENDIIQNNRIRNKILVRIYNTLNI